MSNNSIIVYNQNLSKVNKSCNLNHKNDFKIIHINARSLYPNKILNLKLLAEDLKPLIICVSETWLTKDVPDVAINIPNFNVNRYDTNNCGSVCIYTHNSLLVNKLSNYATPSIKGLDILILKVQLGKFKSFIVTAIYLHPPVNKYLYSELINIFNYLTTLNKPIYVLGDFNINMLDNSNHISKSFKHYMTCNKLYQVITEPTRITETSKTLIDLCITNNKNINYAKSLCDNNIADHNTIVVSINLQVPKCEATVTKTFRSCKNYNKTKFNDILSSQPFDNLVFHSNIDNAILEFNNLFVTSLDTISPLVTKPVKKIYKHL